MVVEMWAYASATQIGLLQYQSSCNNCTEKKNDIFSLSCVAQKTDVTLTHLKHFAGPISPVLTSTVDFVLSQLSALTFNLQRLRIL